MAMPLALPGNKESETGIIGCTGCNPLSWIAPDAWCDAIPDYLGRAFATLKFFCLANNLYISGFRNLLRKTCMLERMRFLVVGMERFR